MVAAVEDLYDAGVAAVRFPAGIPAVVGAAS